MATRTDLFGVLFSELAVEENFNIRYDYGNIQELTDSIAENGIQNPIHCYQKKGDINKYTLIEGHRRYKAIELGIQQKKIDPLTFRIPMVKSRPISDENRTLGLVTYNSGKPLTLLEEAMVYERLDKFGMSVAEMAKKVGKSSTHISNCLLLMAANIATKKMIMDNIVSPTLVISRLKEKDPAEVEKEIKEALKDKQADLEVDTTHAKSNSSTNADIPKKQDNTKFSGSDTRVMKESSGKPIRITEKNLKAKVHKYTKESILELLVENNFEDLTAKEIYNLLEEKLS